MAYKKENAKSNAIYQQTIIFKMKNNKNKE